MLVRILRRSTPIAVAGHSVGDVVDVDPMLALPWIQRGEAELHEEKAVQSAPENKMLGMRAIKRQRL
jgi:hypothetical protein